MHFKKIVAGFLSASILATTAIVAPVTVSAMVPEGECTVIDTFTTQADSTVVASPSYNSVWYDLSENDKTWTWESVLADENVYVKVSYSMDEIAAGNHDNGYAYGIGDWYTGDIKPYNGTAAVPIYYDGSGVTAGKAYDACFQLSDLAFDANSVDQYGKIGFNIQPNMDGSWTILSVQLVEYVTGEIEEEEEVKIPEGYTSHTFEKSQWSDGAEATVVSIDTSTVEPTDTITFTYETNVSNSAWKIAYVDTATWTKNISSAQGALTYTATVQDLMDAADVDTVSGLGSAIAIQIWNTAIGDQIAYKYEIKKADKPISGETEGKTITYEQVDDATAATESCGYSDAKGSTEDSKTYAQVSDNTTWRIYKLVSLEELKGKTSASVIVTNNLTGKAVKLTTKVVYQKLNSTTAALEGYAYVVFVIKNVTNSFDVSSSHFESDLMWSDITLN